MLKVCENFCGWSSKLDKKSLFWSLMHKYRYQTSRSHTTRLEIISASLSGATTRCHCGGPKMNRFEHVSSDHHQMPLSPLWTDRLLWKHCLPTTSFPDGNLWMKTFKLFFSGKPNAGQYDVFGDHVLYQSDFASKYFPNQRSFYVTTIREPFDRLESHLKCFRYFCTDYQIKRIWGEILLPPANEVEGR